MTQIKTKHHHLLDPDMPVTVLAPEGGLAVDAALFDFNRAAFAAFVSHHANLARFIIDQSLVNLVHKDTAHQALLEMNRCDVFRLPFPAVWVEVPSDNGALPHNHTLVLLWEKDVGLLPIEAPQDMAAKAAQIKFGACVINLHKDAAGEYLSTPPFFLALMFNDENNTPMVGALTQPVPYFGCLNAKRTNENTKATFYKATGVAWVAAFAALLLVNTRGVAAKQETFDKLNKRRASEQKPTIPTYRYIHINRVYRTASGDESDAYDPRTSPMPHWRRGHARRVAYGAKRTARRWHWFPPILVALSADAAVPAMPKYQVAE